MGRGGGRLKFAGAREAQGIIRQVGCLVQLRLFSLSILPYLARIFFFLCLSSDARPSVGLPRPRIANATPVPSANLAHIRTPLSCDIQLGAFHCLRQLCTSPALCVWMCGWVDG